MSSNAEVESRISLPHMRYIVQRGGRESYLSSAYAIYCLTRRSRVVSLFRICDISFNAEVASRISLPHMRYIVYRGGRESYLSSAYAIYRLTRRSRVVSLFRVCDISLNAEGATRLALQRSEIYCIRGRHETCRSLAFLKTQLTIIHVSLLHGWHV